MTAQRCVGVILAGGGATRYGGEPKGLERVGGVRIVDRVASALRPVTEELLLVANAPDAAAWLPGVRVERDVRLGEGALGGLHAALTHARADVLVVAWDMPFVPAALLAAMRAQGEQEGADVVIAEHTVARQGLEPLCAWYSARCLGAVTAALEAGDRRVIGFHDAVRVSRLSEAKVRLYGEPDLLFANVNAPADRDRWDAAIGSAAPPPMLAVVGKKHAGKTTLVATLSSELTRRGHAVMTLKHSSHTFNLEPDGTDTWRHLHEGQAERVAMASPDKFALVARWSKERAPEEIAARYLGEARLVLCEGFKRSALPKVEIARRAAHATSLYEEGPANASTWRAMVSDAPVAKWDGLRFDLHAPDWLDALAAWVEREYLSPAPR